MLPLFLAEAEPRLQALSPPLAEAQTELWLLSHPESRQPPRVAAVAAHLAAQVHLD